MVAHSTPSARAPAPVLFRDADVYRMGARVRLSGRGCPTIVLGWRIERGELQFVLAGGRFGTLALDVSATPPERLVAHWTGYAEQNGYGPEAIAVTVRMIEDFASRT